MQQIRHVKLVLKTCLLTCPATVDLASAINLLTPVMQVRPYRLSGLEPAIAQEASPNRMPGSKWR